MTTFLPLPQLDDLRWSQLVDEGRALVPLYAPDWTDHNASDPGITLIELFAWLAEAQGFQLDQIPAHHRLKFLSLVGITPAPPRPASTVLRFGLPAGSPPVLLPAGAEAAAAAAAAIRYRTLAPIEVVATRLHSITSVTPAGSRDLGERWRRGEPFAPFGDDALVGSAIVLALDAPLPQGVTVSIYITSADDDAGADARALITSMEKLARERCRTPDTLVDCDPEPDGVHSGPPRLCHHAVRTVWELEVGPDSWRPLDPDTGEVDDRTRAFTLDGCVEIVAPAQQYARTAAGGVQYRIRCRLARGRYDAPPVLRDIAVNGVAAAQAVPAFATWPIAPKATIDQPPQPGPIHLGVELDGDDRVVRLDPSDSSSPETLAIDYEAASKKDPGALTAEAVLLGRSTGLPEQLAVLPGAPVDETSVRLWTREQSSSGTWRTWTLRPDLDASGPADAHAVLDAAGGTIAFGDGARGLVPPLAAAFVAEFRTTGGRAGNTRAGTIDTVSPGPHNSVALDDAVRSLLDVTNPVAATGGDDAETLEHAEGRASLVDAEVTRAVTLADLEQLARTTPGTRVARAVARANLHPAFPCVEAIGVVTVVVLPSLPAGQPTPTAELLRAVSAYLNTRRVVGTRIDVTGPSYTVVSVRARVSVLRAATVAEVVRRVADALGSFFDPLHGGQDGTGWPLGRDVIRSEVLQVIDAVPGVDHVLDLELVDEDGASCGNICIGPLGLVKSGAHVIEVAAA
jgi:predicted phage baseplate assembly protein